MHSSKRFAFCQCFLSQNIFLHKLGLHVKYVSDAQFQNDYENVIPRSDISESLQIVKQEIQRRWLLRENVLDRINHIQIHYQPLFPHVYNYEPSKVIVEDVEAQSVGKGVFSLPVFQETFVEDFMSELRHFKAAGLPHEQPNSMNRHGILLDEIRFQQFFDGLRSQFIQPWARKLFNEPDLVLDSHKAFVVKYALGEDVDLSAHFDNAEITLNVALNHDFDEGELIFNKVNPQSGNVISRIGYEHRYCHGVLHRGSHLHEALPISRGERWNLIVWARSSHVRNSCCPMCKSMPKLKACPLGTYGDGFLLDLNSSSCNTI